MNDSEDYDESLAEEDVEEEIFSTTNQLIDYCYDNALPIFNNDKVLEILIAFLK